MSPRTIKETSIYSIRISQMHSKNQFHFLLFFFQGTIRELYCRVSVRSTSPSSLGSHFTWIEERRQLGSLLHEWMNGLRWEDMRDDCCCWSVFTGAFYYRISQLLFNGDFSLAVNRIHSRLIKDCVNTSFYMWSLVGACAVFHVVDLFHRWKYTKKESVRFS